MAHANATTFDPSLVATMHPPMPPTPGQAVAIVLKPFVEATNKLLIYLTQIGDVLEAPKES